MRVFVGEPGYEYKENFRTLSNAALAGGVTSVVTMPNTSPGIDNVSMVDFLKRRGRDKSKINIFPTASLTKGLEGTNMNEFGLLNKKGINISSPSQPINQINEAQLRDLMASEEYHNPTKRNPEVVRQVESGFKQIYKS